MNIIQILWIYPHFVDIIHIRHITTYLARNVSHVIHSFVLVVDVILIDNIIHSFVLVVDIICIVHITSYLSCNVCPIFNIYSSSGSDWCIISFPVCKLIYFLFLLPFTFFIFWVNINSILTLYEYLCLLLSLQ